MGFNLICAAGVLLGYIVIADTQFYGYGYNPYVNLQPYPYAAAAPNYGPAFNTFHQGYGQPYPGYYPRWPYQYPTQQNAFPHIKAEIIDVSPEYQRQILGLPNSAPSGNVVHGKRYSVIVNSDTKNYTSVPANVSKTVVDQKIYKTNFTRTIVYDPNKKNEPINIRIVNGVEVTTDINDTNDTETDNVQNSTGRAVTPKPRRFMDVPSSCPEGTIRTHKGTCLEPFALREPNSQAKENNDD